MNHLLRSVAPITEDGWAEIDSEAKERLEVALAARKLVDFSGPHGWEYSATSLGRVEAVDDAPGDGVEMRRRRVLPLVEVRVPFTLSREELRAGDRGAVDVDYGPLDEAAQRTAAAENVAVMHGVGDGGITASSSHPAITLSEDFDEYPGDVAKALEMMRREGVGGPFGLALGPACYTGVIESTEHGGYLVLDHLSKILDGPVVWAPGVEGAVVLSLRGGDFLFESGQDLSVGYEGHDDAEVRLYLEESFSFRVATPEAAVALTLGS